MDKQTRISTYARIARNHNALGVIAIKAGETTEASYRFTCAQSWLSAAKAVKAPQVAQETRSDIELATMLLDDGKDYWTAQDGRLLVNFHDKGVWRMVAGCEDLEWSQRETLVMHLLPRHRIIYATSAQAYEWLATSEQYTYCIDTLEISAHDANADYLVNKFEARLTEILKLESEHIE